MPLWSHSPVGNDGVMTPTQRVQGIVFAIGMLVASGLSFRAGMRGEFDLPRGDRTRTRTLLAPVVLIFASLAIFPWTVVL